MLEKLFKLKQHNTTAKTEIVAGVTTFMTMAYILAVNPDLLAAAGMDKNGVFVATCLASFIGTMCMAIFSNYPFALAPGMGLNAFFAFSVCGIMGYPWQVALAAVFVEGIIFIVLSLFNVREIIFNAIPTSLKRAVSVGIGLFIAFIGMQNSKIVVSNAATKVSFFSLEAVPGATFNDAGIAMILAVLGVLITAILVIKNVKGNILIGILATWGIGILLQVAGVYVPNPEAGYFDLLPNFAGGLAFSGFPKVFGHLDFSKVFTVEFIVIVFSFLFVDLFDTLGTLIGVSNKANMLDKDGKLPKIKGALMADAVATTAGAVLGTSTTTTFVESAAGVTEGGRTGLTSATTAILFGLALFISPIFLAIPSFATAPALIVVGFYMLNEVGSIDFKDFASGIPAFICIIAMPFCYSISEGIAMGVISFVVLHLFGGKDKRKEVSIVMYILAILFVLKYVFV